MARPPLPIGTWGNIRTEKLGPTRYCARARFRDHDGKTRDVEATDTTGPAAIRALRAKLRDRVAHERHQARRAERELSANEPVRAPATALATASPARPAQRALVRAESGPRVPALPLPARELDPHKLLDPFASE